MVTSNPSSQPINITYLNYLVARSYFFSTKGCQVYMYFSIVLYCARYVLVTHKYRPLKQLILMLLLVLLLVLFLLYILRCGTDKIKISKYSVLDLEYPFVVTPNSCWTCLTRNLRTPAPSNISRSH